MKTPIRTALVAIALIVAGSLFAYRGTLPLAHAQGTPSVAAFASSSRAAGTYLSGALTPPPGTSGVLIQLNLTSCTSGCGVSERLLEIDPLTGSTSAAPTGETTEALAVVGGTDLLVYPGITAVTNRRINDRLVSYPVPVTYKVRMTVTAANAKTDSSVTWVQ